MPQVPILEPGRARTPTVCFHEAYSTPSTFTITRFRRCPSNSALATSYATTSKPFFSTRDRSLSEAPRGCFSPRSHLLTRLGVTFR